MIMITVWNLWDVAIVQENKCTILGLFHVYKKRGSREGLFSIAIDKYWWRGLCLGAVLIEEQPKELDLFVQYHPPKYQSFVKRN
jgi:hypothetical protein